MEFDRPMAVGVRKSASWLAASGAIVAFGAFAPAAAGFAFTHAAGSPYHLDATPDSVAVGDLDGDGLPDLTVGSFSVGGASDLEGSAGIYTLLNEAGGFGAPTPRTLLGGGQ